MTYIYEYGLELVLTSIINVVVIIVMGICTKRLIESIALLAFVIPLQSCGGGYHAETHMRCFLIMFTGWWWVMWMLPYMSLLGNVVIACISLVTIFFLAPVANENVPMSEQQFYKMKILVRVLSVIAAFIGIAVSLYGKDGSDIGNSLALALAVVALSMIAAKVKKKRYPRIRKLGVKIFKRLNYQLF